MPGTFSPAFVLFTYQCSWVISQKVGERMRELSIFIDESGSDNLLDYYYILTIVLHDQSNNLDYSIKLYENSLEQKHLPNIPFHASPLMNKKDNYKCLDMSIRKKLLQSFRIFFRHVDICYHTFVYTNRKYESTSQLSAAMRKDLINFLFDNMEYMQQYEKIKIYYDNGQQSIVNAIHKAMEYSLSKNATIYRYAKQSQYRLAQIADYICMVELTKLKYENKHITKTDEKFFGSWSDFKKGILKETRHKAIE